MFSSSFLGSSYKGEFCTNLVLSSSQTAQVTIRRYIILLPFPIMETMIKTLGMTYHLGELFQVFFTV